MKYKEIAQNLFSGQIENNAGGYFYKADPWERLDRFLILGTEAGTYYVSPVALTKQNTTAIQALLEDNGIKVVERIVEISISGRAPKNDAALFALALCASSENESTRQAALAALPKVARTGTHLLQFADYVNNQRGWGRALRRAVGNWFTQMPIEQLCLQAVKYSKRNGWSLRDLLRLSHPKCTEDEERSALLHWIAKPDDSEVIQTARRLRLIEGKYQAKNALSSEELAHIVQKYSLPREALPTQALSSKEVWDALLVDMPMMAMIRNLGKMTQVGLLHPFAPASEYVASRLNSNQALIEAKINPFHLLLALRVYAKGEGDLGSLTWGPVPSIVKALEEAFEMAFTVVSPTNKRILVAVDVSGSMQMSTCAGSPRLSVVEAAAAVGLFLARTEKNARMMAFDIAVQDLMISPQQKLKDVIEDIRPFGRGTDLAVPIQDALNSNLEVDAFIILTDNETWVGNEPADEILRKYRKQINPDAKLVVMAMAANHGTICDPEDSLSFGVAGFDASAPQLAMDFIDDSRRIEKNR